MNINDKRQKKLLVTWIITMSVLALCFCTLLWQGIHVNANLLSLLPASGKTKIEAEVSHRFNHTLGQSLIFLVSSPNKSVAEKAADTLYRDLNAAKGQEYFQKIRYRVATKEQKAWVSLYYPHHMSLLSPTSQALLQTKQYDLMTKQALYRLYSPFSLLGQTSLSDDPFFLFQSFMTSLPSPSTHMQLTDQRLMTSIGQRWYVLIQTQVNKNMTDFSTQLRAVDFINTTITKLQRQWPGVYVLKTGMLFYNEAGSVEAQNNITFIGLGSLLGIILLMLWIFRSITPLLFVLFSSAAGFLAAFVVTQMLFGTIHIFTLVFGASLIGISVDYAYFYYADRFFGGPTWKSKDGLSRIINGISLGLFNMVLAYFVICLVPFAGLRQLATFSMTGLIVAYSTVICLFPLVIKPSNVNKPNLLITFNKIHITYWKNVSLKKLVSIYMVILVISSIGLIKLKTNDDVHILATMPKLLKQEETKINTITGNAAGNHFIIIKGQTTEATLQHMQQVTHRLDQAFPNIGSRYISISDYLPTTATQWSNYQAQRALIQQQLPNYLQRIGMSATQIHSIKTKLLQQRFNPLTLSDILNANSTSMLKSLWLGPIAGQEVGVILLSNQLSAVKVAKIIAPYPNALYVNRAIDITHVFHSYRLKMTYVLIGVYLLLACWLAIRYGIRRGSILILPAVTAALFTFGLLGLLGIPLTLFSMLAAILVFGIVVDYVIFFAETKSSYQSTMLAVVLSAITTLLSFGLLALSSNMAIHYFGVTIAIGILNGFLLVPMIARLSLGGHDEI